jgi:hypothetical protein
MVTPGTTAPELSVTDPEIRPEFCARREVITSGASQQSLRMGTIIINLSNYGNYHFIFGPLPARNNVQGRV